VKGLSFYTAFGGSGGLPPLCVCVYGRQLRVKGGEFPSWENKGLEGIFNPSNVAGFNCS